MRNHEPHFHFKLYINHNEYDKENIQNQLSSLMKFKTQSSSPGPSSKFQMVRLRARHVNQIWICQTPKTLEQSATSCYEKVSQRNSYWNALKSCVSDDRFRVGLFQSMYGSDVKSYPESRPHLLNPDSMSGVQTLNFRLDCDFSLQFIFWTLPNFQRWLT